MANAPTIGIIGERDPHNPTHLATEAAFCHLENPIAFEWVPTDGILPDARVWLAPYRGFLIAPASPYASMEGALAAIRHAREAGIPLLGTCGGFQHILVEFARHVLGIPDADHAETNPGAPKLAVTPLACSRVGQSHPVRILQGTRAEAAYGVRETVEPFYCNYGLNPEYREAMESRGLKVSGLGEDGEVRIMEIPGLPFFMGTLFVPQALSRPGQPHPLVEALAAAART